jgi:hypothetical protein
MRELVYASFRATVRPTFFSFALITFALITGLFAGAHAFAQEYPARAVGGWTVAASKDDKGCFLTRTYERAGGTTLLLGLDTDGSNRLSVLNDNWSIKQMDRWELNFRLSKGGYSNHAVVGMTSGGKKGFVTNFETEFPSHFAKSRALHIYRGDVPVEQLNLDGSGAAVAELRRCVGLIADKAAGGAGEKGSSGEIPTDPFAPDAKPKPKD